MQTLFWNDFYLFLKSFREIEVRYITAICCPMFLSNAPRRGSYKVSQLAWIFSLSILYCRQNISWCLCSAKALLNLLLTVECYTFDLFIPFYIIYFYLFILFSHHGCSMWLKSANIIRKFMIHVLANFWCVRGRPHDGWIIGLGSSSCEVSHEWLDVLWEDSRTNKINNALSAKTITATNKQKNYKLTRAATLLVQYCRAFSITRRTTCKFIGIKGVYIRKEFHSHRIGLVHQHGCRDVMWKHSVRSWVRPLLGKLGNCSVIHREQ